MQLNNLLKTLDTKISELQRKIESQTGLIVYNDVIEIIKYMIETMIQLMQLYYCLNYVNRLFHHAQLILFDSQNPFFLITY